MSKSAASDSSLPYKTAKLMGKPVVQRCSISTPTPSGGRSENKFECPLCVDVFKNFSHLKCHLLSMHPIRTNIMRLVKERYGISKNHTKPAQSATVASQYVLEQPSIIKTAEILQPVEEGRGTATEVFKAPLKFRHKATAFPHMTKKDRPATSCKDLADSRMKYEFVPKLSPEKERSSWDSYLSYCVSDSARSNPVRQSYYSH